MTTARRSISASSAWDRICSGVGYHLDNRPLADRERTGDRIDLRGVPGAGLAAAEAEAGLDVRAGVL